MVGISLEKRAEKVEAILLTKGIKTAPTMRVGNALDISGSMDRTIARGDLQEAFSQTMGVALTFDDNGELDVFKFNHGCQFVDTADKNNYETFINKKGISANGGTSYAPVIEEAIKFYFEAKKVGGFLGFGGKTVQNNEPVLMLIHTDGEPSDASATKRALNNAKKYPIYFHFVGVGGTRSNFPTIADLADEFPNVGEVYLPRFDMSDDEVYNQLICDELVDWIGNHSASSASA